MRLTIFLAATVTLAGCSASDNADRAPSAAMVETADVAPSPAKSGDAPERLTVALPQLAYTYALAYLLPGDRIASTQDQHRRLCEQMGPARCQLLTLERGSGPDRTGDALLKMRVATADARGFQNALDGAIDKAGGRPAGTKVAAEDVSKAMVDTEARIRQRGLLVARLTDVLRTRTGKVAELVEAERSVAGAQEELDQARGWLAELRGRVAMSEFEIRYTAIAPSTSPQSVGGQLGEAAQGSGATFLIGLRLLLTLAIYFAPWLLLAVPVMFLLAMRRRRRDSDAAQV